MKEVTIHFYSDPGHGWGRVSRKLLEELEILNDITAYSYQSATGKSVYLEEDLDLTTLLIALKGEGYNVNWRKQYYQRHCRIRNLPHFRLDKLAA